MMLKGKNSILVGGLSNVIWIATLLSIYIFAPSALATALLLASVATLTATIVIYWVKSAGGGPFSSSFAEKFVTSSDGEIGLFYRALALSGFCLATIPFALLLTVFRGVSYSKLEPLTLMVLCVAGYLFYLDTINILARKFGGREQ